MERKYTQRQWIIKLYERSLGDVMPFIQRDYWPCPFCDKGIIEVIVRPPMLQARRSRSAAAGTKTKWYKSREEVVIVSKECPVCHKTREEIEKKWKEEGII